MAEAAATVGLIASIITLVDIGTKIVSRVRDFTSQTSDVPRSFQALADRLPLLIQTLQRIQTRAQVGDVPTDVAKDLKTLVDSINIQVETLAECLQKIAPTADASRLRKTIKALESLSKDDHVTQAVTKVHEGIEVLVLHQTTANIDLSDRILHELAQLKLDQPPTKYELGLWLDRAPSIDPAAFLGRTKELRQLYEWLSPKSEVVNQKVASIVGMGGLGKTQLSLAYARKFGSQYSSVFWLNAKDQLSLQQSMLTLSHSIFVDEDAGTRNQEVYVQKVRRWLSSSQNGRWLIIFDNYDDPSLPNLRSSTGFDIRQFFPLCAHGSIIVTTRSPKLIFSQRLMLEKLDDPSLQVAILSQRAGRDLGDEIGSQQLASRLGGLPLALASAGTYIGQTGISCAEYLDMYEKSWSELHGPESEVLLEYGDRTLSSTWILSLNQVSTQDADAVELLKFFALFDGEDVWYDLLRAGSFDRPVWLDRVISTKIRFDRAITKLRDYSLIDIILGSYRVHPCMHDWLLAQFQSSSRSWFWAAAACVAANIPDTNSPKFHSLGRRSIRHVQRLLQEQFRDMWDSHRLDEAALNIGFTLGYVSHMFSRFPEAEQLYTWSLAGYEQALGANHGSTLRTINNLGSLYTDQGRLVSAEQMYTKAMTNYEDLLRAEHSTAVITLHNLASLYANQGRTAHAARLFTQALDVSEKRLGAGHSSTLGTVISIGDVYADQGKLLEAEQMYTRALARLEGARGKDLSLKLTATSNLAVLYMNQGKLEQAEQIYKQALAGSQELFGTEHISTLRTITNIGSLYLEQGKLSEAEQMFIRALAGYKSLIGPEHSSVCNTMNGLGLVYTRQGKQAEAEKMYTQALAGFEKSLGTEHRLTLTTIHNIGILYAERLQLGEAEQMFKRALAGQEKMLGVEHTSTLGTVNCLGALYEMQNKLGEAETMYSRALTGFEKALGAGHTSTLTVSNNLAGLYSKQYKLAEAEQIYTRILTGFTKALGQDHPSTQLVASNLEIARRDRSRLVDKMNQSRTG